MAVNMTAQSIAVKQNWLKSGNSYIGNRPDGGSSGDVYELLATLTGAGRFSFYIDYSELSDVGTHTFYVARTHGSTGAVSVDYATAGDTHTTASGTLNWADGDLSIRSFTATVSSKSNGDHRIYATLSNPTGGAVLHNGTKTKAYGVIDDGTIAADSDAVFFDADAVSNGTGTQASPYNNIYDAISNVGSKRYIYGKGTQDVDTTDAISLFGQTNYGINVPATRSSEETRVYIRNWPGFTCTIQGDGTTSRRGFSTYESTHSFHTYRGLDFNNLDNSGTGSSAAISYYYGTCTDINIEHCTADNLNGLSGTNSSAWALWGVDGGKIWRSTTGTVTLEGAQNQNAAGYQSYKGANISIQRCEFGNSHTGVFQKRAPDNDLATVSCRFNIFKNTGLSIWLSEQGATSVQSPAHFYPIIQSNFIDGKSLYFWRTEGMDDPTTSPYIANNVFSSAGYSIRQKYSIDGFVFNNIHVNCSDEFSDATTTSSYGDPVAFLDYNCGYNTTSPEFALLNAAETLADMQVLGFGNNNITTDPLFTNLASDDITLGGSSPCLGSGVGGSDMGVYLTGIEVLGA